MAAPSEITIRDLSGKYIMNKTLSSDTDAILAFQGIGWLTRKAISLATITLNVKQHSSSSSSTVHIDIDQTATGGLKGTSEHRELDWSTRGHKDGIFGEVVGKSRFVKLEELGAGEGVEEKEWFGAGWETGTGEWVQSFVVNEKAGWTANQLWGFMIIDGKRYYCRKVVIKKGNEKKEARLVYDYVGKAE